MYILYPNFHEISKITKIQKKNYHNVFLQIDTLNQLYALNIMLVFCRYCTFKKFVLTYNMK